jgi:hypothetical protein
MAAAIQIGGCKGEVEVQSTSETVPVAPDKATLKARLSEIATTGVGGSATSGLRDGLLELKKTDDALATQLLQDLDRLERLQDSEQIKALAGSMADKL